MSPRIDLSGQKFNRWTVESYSHTHKGNAFYNCTCDCGTKKVVNGNNVKRGLSKSCGCQNSEKAREHCLSMKKHGMYESKIYRRWVGIIGRCESPSAGNYIDYGARGISVCDEWHDFETFYKWALDNGFEEHLTLDRIDVNGNYEPGNCRWTTWSVQNRNKRTKEQVKRDREKYYGGLHE